MAQQNITIGTANAGGGDTPFAAWTKAQANFTELYGNFITYGTGVAAWLTTPTSANLKTAITDETGSGALVFATSPTLVTPILGTPTSVTLTNATGLPPVSGIVGWPANASGILNNNGSGVLTWSNNISGNSATATALQTSRTIGIITGDANSSGSSFDGTANNTNSITVTKINGTSLAGLATGLLKNTTSTGVPSIATVGIDYQLPLTPTAEKTANYTAVSGDLVLCDATSSSFTITLPTAPSDGTRIGVKMVKPVNATAFTITVALGGSDHINRTTGPTTTTLTRLGRTLNFQYKSSSSVWYVTESDEALERSVQKVYNVEYYGAVHDGVQTTAAGTINNGSTTFSCSSASFTTSDVGKVIEIPGAGAAGVNLVTTISAFLSSTSVTIAVAASTSVSTSICWYGTDDTAAIQRAINACFLNKGSKVFFPTGVYIISGALVTSNLGGNNPNSQLYIPETVPVGSNGVSGSITLEGEAYQPFGSTAATAGQNLGVILKSTMNQGTGTRPSVIGTSFYAATTFHFNYLATTFVNLNVMLSSNGGTTATNMTGINGFSFVQVSSSDVSINMDINPQTTTTMPTPLGTGSCGFIISQAFNNGPNTIRNTIVMGAFEHGFVCGEHIEFQNCYSILNYNAVTILPNNFYGVTGHIYIGECPFNFYRPNGTFFGLTQSTTYRQPVNILLDFEKFNIGPSWSFYQGFVNDAAGFLIGEIKYKVWAGGSTGTDNSQNAFTSMGNGSYLNVHTMNTAFPNTFNINGGPMSYFPAFVSGNANNYAAFQISSGVATSTAANSAHLILSTNQSGTSTQLLGAIEVINDNIGGAQSAERRGGVIGFYTNGAVNTTQRFDYLLNAGTLTQIANLTPTNYGISISTQITQPVLTSSWVPAVIATPGAHTGMTTATEFPNFRFDGATQIAASGTTTTQRNFYIKRVTYAGTSGTRTITNPYGLYVEDSAAGTNGALTNNYAIGADGSIALVTAGNKIFIKEGTNGSVGQTTLVAGTKAITISGVTTSTRAFIGFVSPGGTVTTTWQYKMVCTANTLTITAIDSTGATNTSDTSTLNYFLIEPTP